MFRFVLGFALGGAVMYWFLTGQIPWRGEVESWFAHQASSYTAEEHRRVADHLVDRH
jgi:hypothetical protein